MTTLREKMKQEMVLRGLSESTQDKYLNYVIQLHDYYQKSPAKLSKLEIKDYFLYLIERRKLSPSTYNTHIYALRFFYFVTLRSRSLTTLDLPTRKVPVKLPDILNQDEVTRIIKAESNLKHRALLMVIYGSGLRISEAVNLRRKDLDSKALTIHIRAGKGGKDRYVALPKVVCDVLMAYWKISHFETYVFTPLKDPNKPLSISSASQIFKSAKAKAGVTKEGGPHALRHAFATHSLESGVDIFTIKEILGHASIQSTIRYLTLTPHHRKSLKSPIEQLDL